MRQSLKVRETSLQRMQIEKGFKQMAKQSQSSKAKQTKKGSSQTRSQMPQDLQDKVVITDRLQTALSKLSEDQLTKAILEGQKLAMLDALSMIKRKNLQHEISQRKIT